MIRAFLYLVIFVFSSCNRDANSEEFNLKAYLDQTQQGHRLVSGAYFVVPLFSGCHSCEETIITFLKNDPLSKKCRFILSMHQSRKVEFENLVKEHFNGHIPSNVLFDFQDGALKFDLVFAVSKLFYIHNGHVRDSKELTALNIDTEIKNLRVYLRSDFH